MSTNNEWLKVKKITESIYSIDDNGSDTLYLVNGEKYSLLIDTGWGIGDLKGIITGLTDLPLIVVNTHGHPDHVDGNYLYTDIHIAEADIPSMEGCFDEERRRWVLENLLKGPYPADFNKEMWIKAKLSNVIPIKDKHIFDLGNRRLEVISIPGHSPGSIALLDETEGFLFSGDSILEGDIWMHLDHSTPLDVFLAGLKKLNARISSFDAILPAHVRTPIETKIISELINGVEEILQGKTKGRLHETFAGNGMLGRFNTCGVIYNDRKLFAP